MWSTRTTHRPADDALPCAWSDGAYARWAERYTPEANLRALEAVYDLARAPGAWHGVPGTAQPSTRASSRSTRSSG